MSDVEHAGWAIGGPGSRLRRRRNPLLGVIALLLLIGGAAAAALGIVRLASEAGPARERILTLGAGRNLVSCRHVPFGRVTRRERLRDEHAFVVEHGSPGDGLGGLWLLFGGAAALVLGVPTAMRWRAGALVPA